MARTDEGPASSRGLRARLRALLPALPSRRRSETNPARVTFSREDARRLNERFAMLDRTERRAIMRAVNRGEGMQKRRDAELAVGVARRQQRFWSRAWLMGPAIALVQVIVTPIGWTDGLLLAAWGALLLGMMAAWWWTRARRAEMINLAIIGPRGSRAGSRPTGRGPAPATERSTARRSRLPGGRPRPAGNEADEPSERAASTEDEIPRTARPPRPRGRKRR